ncbi:MAG: helix-turn-helix domain-containing protein [Chitinophagaceae bacterium]
MGKADKQLKQIGLRLKSYRELKGFSQDYLAGKLNISTSAYSRIERNEVNLTLEKLFLLADIYQISLEQIIYGDDHKSEIMLAQDNESEYKLKLIENSKLLKAYQDQIEILKDQVDYLKAIINKK